MCYTSKRILTARDKSKNPVRMIFSFNGKTGDCLRQKYIYYGGTDGKNGQKCSLLVREWKKIQNMSYEHG